MTDPALLHSHVGTLTVRAAELEGLVADYATWRTRDKAIGGLTTRKDELSRLVASAGRLAQALRVIEAEDAIGPIARSGIADLKTRVEALAKRLEQDTTVLLKQKALEDLKVANVLRALEENALGAWRAFVLAGGDGSGFETVLGKYPKYREAAKRITEIRSQFRALGESLPQSEGTLRTVRKLRAQLSAAIAGLRGGGLDDATLEFLRRAATVGVPLAEVLATPHLLEWLEREEELTASLSVHA